MSRLSEEDLPAPMWAGIIQSLEELNGIRRPRKGKFYLCLLDLGCPSSPAVDIEAPGSWVFVLWNFQQCSSGSQTFRLGLGIIPLAALVLKSLDSDCLTPLAFLVLPLADSRLWDFLASITM